MLLCFLFNCYCSYFLFCLPIAGTRPWLSSWAGPYWTATPTTGWTVWSGGKTSPRRCSCTRPSAPKASCKPYWSVSRRLPCTFISPFPATCTFDLPTFAQEGIKSRDAEWQCTVNGFLSSSPPLAANRGLIEGLMDHISTWQVAFEKMTRVYKVNGALVWSLWKHSIRLFAFL